MTGVAVVTGASGQDGWYLCQALVSRGRRVYGLVRDTRRTGLPPGVEPLTGDLRDVASLCAAVGNTAADVVFNLAGVSSVAASWRDPVGTADINALGVARLLQVIEEIATADGRHVRLLQASSAEIFGRHSEPSDEATPIAPINPYGASKAYAHQLVRVYRDNGLHASSAILFNHESSRRPEQFVTRKITKGVARIAAGTQGRLELGNIDVIRDWGFAGDHMQALIAMSEQDQPGDYVIATGVGHTVRDFVDSAFRHVGIMDWQHLVTTSDAFRRPTDVPFQVGRPERAAATLGWTAATSFDAIVGAMVQSDVDAVRH